MSSPVPAYVPRAISELTEAERRLLATDAELREGWFAMERRRCADPQTGFSYWIARYGMITDTQGRWLAPEWWPAQDEAIEAIARLMVAVFIKSRRMGISWIALHYAVWVACFKDGSAGIRVLNFCKTEEEAMAMLDRAREIVAAQPDFLRPALDVSNTTKMKIAGRGSLIQSLPCTESAANGPTAGLIIWDEAGDTANAEQMWASMQPAIEGDPPGQIIVIGTGHNGRVGKGRQFYEICRLAQASEDPTFQLIFLPYTARPGRTDAWYRRELAKATNRSLFQAYYPRTFEEAFSGGSELSVYNLDAIQAAIDLAREIGELDLSEGVEVSADWGQTMTAALYGTSLEHELAPSGGIYIVDEFINQDKIGPRRTQEMLFAVEPGGQAAPVVRFACDSAPAGTALEARELLFELEKSDPDRYPLTDGYDKVFFSTAKEGGSAGSAYGVNTIGYISHLLSNTLERNGGPMIAIHPRCTTLIEQLRSYRRNDKGLIVKKDDHAPDALVAFCAERASIHWEADMAYDPDEHHEEAA